MRYFSTSGRVFTEKSEKADLLIICSLKSPEGSVLYKNRLEDWVFHSSGIGYEKWRKLLEFQKQELLL